MSEDWKPRTREGQYLWELIQHETWRLSSRSARKNIELTRNNGELIAVLPYETNAQRHIASRIASIPYADRFIATATKLLDIDLKQFGDAAIDCGLRALQRQIKRLVAERDGTLSQHEQWWEKHENEEIDLSKFRHRKISDRDAAITDAWDGGETMKSVAGRLNISTARVMQIVHKTKLTRGIMPTKIGGRRTYLRPQ